MNKSIIFISNESVIEFQSGEPFNIVESCFNLATGEKSAIQVDNGCNNKIELVSLTPTTRRNICKCILIQKLNSTTI